MHSKDQHAQTTPACGIELQQGFLPGPVYFHNFFQEKNLLSTSPVSILPVLSTFTSVGVAALEPATEETVA